MLRDISGAKSTLVVDRAIDEGMIAVIGCKQQEEGEEREAGKNEEEVEKQRTVELPRPSNLLLRSHNQEYKGRHTLQRHEAVEARCAEASPLDP